jgi:serine/threonine-protein kinase
VGERSTGDPRIGQQLGSYRLEALIGEGGMGAVYRAVHVRLPRRVAVKLLRDELVGQAGVLDRFRREAEIASSLGHPGLVQVLDFDCAADGTPYIVLELLEGESLAARLARRGRLSLPEVAELADQLCAAMSAAHERGIVHRDLKPQNVFLCPDEGRDRVKVLDFGVSKMLAAPALTCAGALFGTPRYMSPEQAQGLQGEIDQRTDVFALGAIFYECLTGAAAFDAPSLASLVHLICYGPHLDAREIVPGLPPAVARVLDGALAKSADERHPTAEALRRELLAACAAEPPPRRRGGRAAGLLLGAAGFAIGLTVAAWLGTRGAIGRPAGAPPKAMPVPVPVAAPAPPPPVAPALPVEAEAALDRWLTPPPAPVPAEASPPPPPRKPRARPRRAAAPLPGLMEDDL